MTLRPGAVAVAVGAAVAFAGATHPAAAAHSPICTRGDTSVERDPRGLLPLTGTNPVAAATVAALRYEPSRSRPQVKAALFATGDRQRGPQARYACGARVWRRTIVVYVTDRVPFPPRARRSAAYFVGSFESGYRVWQIVH